MLWLQLLHEIEQFKPRHALYLENDLLVDNLLANDWDAAAYSRRRIEGLNTELEIIGREAAVGIDTAQREAAATEKLQAEEARLAQLEARWEEEKGVVDQILEDPKLNERSWRLMKEVQAAAGANGLVIEDAPAGIQAAKAAGMRAIGVATS